MPSYNNCYVSCALSHGETNLYIDVKLYLATTNAYISTLILTHVANGLYTGYFVPTNKVVYNLLLTVYTDVGRTVESTVYGRNCAQVDVRENENIVSYPTDVFDISDGFSVTQGKIDVVGASVDEILIDTDSTLDTKINTISTAVVTTIPSTITTIDGIVDNILIDTGTTLENKINTINSSVSYVLSDTSEIQSELVDGGRLDLLLDSIKTDTGSILWTDITFILDMIGGRWHRVGSQLLFYKANNVDLVATFDLLKSDGAAATEADVPYEAVRV